MWPKQSKYKNVKTSRVLPDGTVAKFDSKKEAVRWDELLFLQSLGKISGLKRQVTYKFVVNGVKICSYRADFEYVNDGKSVTEDVKGVLTAMYKIKKKLMKAVFSIDILET